MAEWLVELGIGEDRAILVDRGAVRRARLQRKDGLAAGLVADAKLISRAAGSARGTVRFDSGEEALIDGLARNAQEGALLRVLVVRAALAEKGRLKRAQARPTDQPPRQAPSLVETLRGSGLPVRNVRRFPDDPWPDLVADAFEGIISFAGGSLTVSSTPAMTLIDVDGTLPPLPLALAAVPSIAATIRRLDLAGSIGIDFPTLEGRDDRRTLDDALASALADWPHQRTAINGFGFVQLVARLERPSLLSAIQGAPMRTGALLAMRRAEDVTAPGNLIVTAHPAVIAAIEPDWRDALARRTGRAIHWHADAALAPLASFAQASSP